MYISIISNFAAAETVYYDKCKSSRQTHGFMEILSRSICRLSLSTLQVPCRHCEGLNSKERSDFLQVRARRQKKHVLVGGRTNPFEKYSSKWVHLPNFRGEDSKNLKPPKPTKSIQNVSFSFLNFSLNRNKNPSEYFVSLQFPPVQGSSLRLLLFGASLVEAIHDHESLGRSLALWSQPLPLPARDVEGLWTKKFSKKLLGGHGCCKKNTPSLGFVRR